jgi:hypothetical protein
MSDFLIIASSLGFIVALFTLYRLLVERQDKTIALLKEEISFRLNNKDRLAEINAFYEAEKKILESRLLTEGTNKEKIQNELDRANEALLNVRKIESSKPANSFSTDALFQRMKSDLQTRLQELVDQNLELSFELENQRNSYADLCEKIKEKYGISVVIELTARSKYEEISLRRKHISRQKHKKLKSSSILNNQETNNDQ